MSNTQKSSYVPVSAFKDEFGYIITFRDGHFDESPVRNLVHLREVARAYGMVIVRRNRKWVFKARRRN